MKSISSLSLNILIITHLLNINPFYSYHHLYSIHTIQSSQYQSIHYHHIFNHSRDSYQFISIHQYNQHTHSNHHTNTPYSYNTHSSLSSFFNKHSFPYSSILFSFSITSSHYPYYYTTIIPSLFNHSSKTQTPYSSIITYSTIPSIPIITLSLYTHYPTLHSFTSITHLHHNSLHSYHHIPSIHFKPLIQVLFNINLVDILFNIPSLLIP